MAHLASVVFARTAHFQTLVNGAAALPSRRAIDRTLARMSITIPSNSAQAAPARPRLPSLAWVFFRFGNFTYGGGSATIATLQSEVVDRRKWLKTEPFHLCYALSRLTPGTNLLACCTAAGWLMRRWTGAFVCLLAASIPCSAFVVAVTALYAVWSRNHAFGTAMRGAMAGAVAVMVATAVTLIRPHWPKSSWLQLVVFVGGSLGLNLGLHVSPLPILIGSGILGWLWSGKAAR